MIVRDTKAEANEYAEHMISKLDDEHGRKIRERALDASSLGVSHQSRNRDMADEFGYIEPPMSPPRWKPRLRIWASSGLICCSFIAPIR